jgi:TolB-like protein
MWRSAALLCAWVGTVVHIFGAGCGGSTPERHIYSASDSVSITNEGQSPTQGGAVPRRLLLIVAEADEPPGDRQVNELMSAALSRRGFELSSPKQQAGSEPMIAIQCYCRRGKPWGGIPSEEVLLRYAILYAGQTEPVSIGQDSGMHADSERSTAVQGALRQAAQRLAQRIERVLQTIPPPSISVTVTPVERDETVATIACLPFRNATGRRDLGGWCETLTSVAAEEYQRVGKYRLMERARLKEVLDEQDVTDAIDGVPSAMQRVGTKLGVDLLLVGEVAVRPDGDIAISARLLRSADAQIEQVIVVNDRASNIDGLEQKFRRRLSKPVAGWMDEKLEVLRRKPVQWPETGP